MKLTVAEKKEIRNGNIEIVWDKYRKKYPEMSYSDLRTKIGKDGRR